jgi:hypothetical protein
LAVPVLAPGLVAAAEPVFLTFGLAEVLVLATLLLPERYSFWEEPKSLLAALSPEDIPLVPLVTPLAASRLAALEVAG